MPPLTAEDLKGRCRALAWLLCDVDGVLTDGRLHYRAGREPAVVFDIKDGLGLKLARRAGLKVGLLSGRGGKAVEARASELRLDAALLGAEDKAAAFSTFLVSHDTAAASVAYIGDDLPDLPVLRRAGLALAPADAAAEVRAQAHHVLSRAGGRGCVREAVELVLRARGQWDALVESLGQAAL